MTSVTGGRRQIVRLSEALRFLMHEDKAAVDATRGHRLEVMEVQPRGRRSLVERGKKGRDESRPSRLDSQA